ncbi:MAG: hypothetical protein H6Q43_199 [Deltaproteobacteria bacterium]|nr:hypothetical protein [Deltaproteobacteria bacterium]
MILKIRFELEAITKNGLISGCPQVLSSLNEEVCLFDLDLERNKAFSHTERPVGSFPVISFWPFGLRSHEESYPSVTCPMRRNFS